MESSEKKFEVRAVTSTGLFAALVRLNDVGGDGFKALNKPIGVDTTGDDPNHPVSAIVTCPAHLAKEVREKLRAAGLVVTNAKE